MSFKCGIVGLPNVGKSTLFNALTNSSKAQAANFPFCTIEPNVGVVPVPDERLDKLVEISKSKKKINTTIEFVDIAGLVEGASKGEGLGNKFLSHIREVDAVIHMIRCFDSDDIQNINSTVDPVRDLETFDKLSSLSSGTGTIPTFGSIVQKGKFAAWALLELVKALNKVDLPTFGKPTIPHLKLIIYYLLY